MEFVITRIIRGKLYFLSGRRGWSDFFGEAYRYKTWERANAAIARKNGKNLWVGNKNMTPAMYSTIDELDSMTDDNWQPLDLQNPFWRNTTLEMA